MRKCALAPEMTRAVIAAFPATTIFDTMPKSAEKLGSEVTPASVPLSHRWRRVLP
jgi:hypothetical protein